MVAIRLHTREENSRSRNSACRSTSFGCAFPNGRPIRHNHLDFFATGNYSLSSTAAIISKSVLLSQKTRSEEHTSELQSRQYLVCRLLLEKKKITRYRIRNIII